MTTPEPGKETEVIKSIGSIFGYLIMSAVTIVEIVWPLVSAIISTSEPTLAILVVT